ncbi:EAL domain-containing protein [Propionivibrio sp.]|uniref:putative bifunctional diguanylate cyclase/phosphodiesterase n=1 Tax=Propionivibrio sp. TaxID=2212460 RepID=UPI002638425A|nr:EAL domain-containing protein [Propionivibrio sp.]
MTSKINDEDFPSLFENEAVASSLPAHKWKVLIVDTDAQVHQSTVLALANIPVLGRTIQFLHAYSTKQAIEFLQAESDVAVILLDVVKEGEDAGLELAMSIRQDLSLRDLRIILRSAQPGYTPALDTIRDYDINDYKTSSGFARDGLYATLTSALRSYAQIHALSVGRRGLDQIIKASSRMMTHPNMHDFAAAIINEIAGLLGLSPEGFVCAREKVSAGSQIRIIAAAGRFARCIDQPLVDLRKPALIALLTRALDERRNLANDNASVLFFFGKSGTELAAYFETGRPLDEINRRLLDVFGTNIAIILDNVELFDQLHEQAYRDPLLNIPNRLAFMHAVGNALTAQPLTTTVALVDIDHFSHLNDALGYRYGDTLLKAVALLLIGKLPEGTLIARMAPDTFGVLGDVQTITPQTLLPLFRDPFVAEGTEQRLSVTIGLTRLSEVDGNASDAIKSAIVALNLAKHHRRGEGVYFTRSMEIEARARMRLLRELRAAFDQQRLFVEYQPQFCLKTQRLIGVEALLRWRNDEGRSIPPDQFIPLAESSGLIVALGKWVLRTACHDLQRLVSDGPAEVGGLHMSVNVSVVQFRHPGFLDSVDEILSESRINPRQLELEITESVAMLDANFMLATLNQIKARGIAIAIDDFGTGFSSLSYLERLNVDRLKIDQSFVNQMMLSNSSLRIVETVVQLGHSLQLQVTAEGVEQQVQADLLERIGCHAGQGYLFARSMPFDQLRALLAAPPLKKLAAGKKG